TEEAEEWEGRLKEQASSPADGQPPERISEERQQALDFIKRPNLVELVLEDMESVGYVGESRGKMLAYLIGVSRLLPRPLAGIILSQSGAGKSGLAEVVEELTPPDSVVLYSRISAQALGYLP